MSNAWLHEWAEQKGQRIRAETLEESSTDRDIKDTPKRGRPKSIKSNVTPKEQKRIYDRRYRNKNRFEINRREREATKTPRGAFNKARKKARERKQGWEFSFKAWWRIWNDAGEFEDPDRPGVMASAWSLRGPNQYKDVMMIRIDTSKGWSPDNCKIVQAPMDYERHFPD